MRRAILRHAFLLLALFFVVSPAEAAKRVALVIGINSYPNLSAERQLKKAVNDAQAIRDTLKNDLGFNEIFYKENADWEQMNSLINEAESQIGSGDVVFIYFSGHGVSIGGVNYLLPSDIPKPKQEHVSRLTGNSFEAEAVTQRMLKRGAQAVFSVLDACRDNPFADEKGKAVGAIDGLTSIDKADGVFTLFAAGLGQVALDRLSDDDPNPNSVFTRSLVPLLKTSGLTHVALAKEVQKQVADLAAKIGHKQRPAYEDGILGFVTLKEPAAGGDAKTAAQTEIAGIDPTADELVHQCDVLAADNRDPDQPATIPGVSLRSINSDDAARICGKAIGKRPDLRRLVFQAGRAYDQADNFKAAISYYKRAAAMGSKAAMAMLFYFYRDGLGVEKNVKEAIDQAKKALHAPDSWRERAVLAFDIAYRYEQGGENLPADPELARAWYVVALEEGLDKGARSLAALIDDGKGGPASSDTAALLLMMGYCRDQQYSRDLLFKEGLAEWTNAVGVALQEILKEEGFYAGDIDGVVGEGTRKALEQGKTTICPKVEEVIKADGGLFASLRKEGMVGEDPRKDLQ